MDFDDFKFIGGLVATMAFAVAAIFGLAITVTSWQCSKYSVVTGKETKFEGMSCYINDNGKWYIWEEYKYRFVTKGTM